MFRQPYLALTSAVADAPKAAVDSLAALIAALKAEAAVDTVAAGTTAAAAAAAAGTAAPVSGGARS
ncbi:hypothetical protein AB0B79_28715 [Streptomyces sp. NPDC039022]|uniref:hypothetical protein n=1 Tax=Streptomyces sp. NPDC039022 TaxID=3157091 RepID=UPI0033E8D9C7